MEIANKVKLEIEKLIEEYNAFVRDSRSLPFGVRSRYLRSGYCAIYVRTLLHPTLTPCFCISSIDIDERLQGKGIMTGFLDYVENNLHDYTGVEFECIHNDKLANHLEKKGYSWSPYRAEYLKELETHLFKEKE